MSAPHRIPVPVPGSGSRGYEVLVGGGLFGSLAALLSRLCPAPRYAVITDDRVAELYALKLTRMLHGAGHRPDVFAFSSGEASKTRETWAAVTDAMLEAGIGRDTAVIAFGGGVPGDLGGFVAATYMRGLPVVQVPTSLLAMIDASIGGKTGVDAPAGKNLVGAFHAPRAVLVDPDLLGTLPDEHLRAGLAEAVKHGAVADDDYLGWIESHGDDLLARDRDALTRLIARSVEIKAEIVAADEREAGPRALLNFGHTVAHAAEAVSGWTLLHGQAVAMGMVEEARIGERLGVTAAGTSARLRRVLAALGLPTSLPLSLDAAEVVARARADKKAREGRTEYSLIKGAGAGSVAGNGRWTYPVADELAAGVLADGAVGRV